VATNSDRLAGPFAILPMTGNRLSVVWTERAEFAAHLAALPDADFAAELAARFGDFLGAVEPIRLRSVHPLGLMLAERYTARRLALVGEAAHLTHSIAGQELNLGIRDVAALAELVSTHVGLSSTSARTLCLPGTSAGAAVTGSSSPRSPTGSTASFRTPSLRSGSPGISASTSCGRSALPDARPRG
jgi:FAD binding domain